MFDGDVNLSVTMTIISSLASFALTTFWTWLLGSNLVDIESAKNPTKAIHIPYNNLILTLLGLAIPLSFGVLFRQKWPDLGQRLHTLIAKPIFLLALIILFVLGLLNSLFIFHLLEWRHILAGFSLGSLGYIFGAVMAKLCHQDTPQVIAISIETALQNFGIAFVVLNQTFDSPYSDLGVLPIIGYYICSTTPILLVTYIFYLSCTVGRRYMESSQFLWGR